MGQNGQLYQILCSSRKGNSPVISQRLTKFESHFHESLLTSAQKYNEVIKLDFTIVSYKISFFIYPVVSLISNKHRTGIAWSDQPEIYRVHPAVRLFCLASLGLLNWISTNHSHDVFEHQCFPNKLLCEKALFKSSAILL